MIRFEKFTENHLELASELFVKRYRKSIELRNELPERYLDTKNIKPYIQWITSTFHSIVIYDDNRFLGYYSGIYIDEFKSKRKGIFTPEWAYGVLNDDIETFNLLYKEMLKHYHPLGVTNVGITVLEHEKKLYDNLVWNGHGLLVVDAIRSIKPVININESIEIRKATMNDFDLLLPLMNEHNLYMMSANTFLYLEDDVRSELTKWLHDENTIIFIASSNGVVIGCMKVVIDGDDASTIIRDHSIIKVTTTHVLTEHQGKHVAATLLNFVNNYALENDFKGLAVDFESANFDARRFWLKHFNVVCYSLFRSIDDRT